jgi:hypothetical protein
MDEGAKRVLGIVAAILASLHMQTADDLFGGPQPSLSSTKIENSSTSVESNRHRVAGMRALCSLHSADTANFTFGP